MALELLPLIIVFEFMRSVAVIHTTFGRSGGTTH